MHVALPKRLSAHRLALHGQVVEGSVPVARLTRLSEMVADAGGEINARLEFGRREGRDTLQLSIDGDIVLQCQRCLGSVRWPLHAAVSLELVASDAEAQRVAEPAEPYMVADDVLEPWQVVEDEAILALPVIARHTDDRQCDALAELAPEPPEERPANPFAVLKDWKKPRQ